MWAQLSTFRVREGKVDDLTRAMEQLQTFEQPDSGLLRTTAMQDQHDPNRVFMFVMFASEESPSARERPATPRRPSSVTR
jgi:quinol monooxygenase YgiN